MLVGAVTVLVWMKYKWFDLYEIIPGFVFATIAIIVVSMVTKEYSAAAQARFDEAEAEYKSH